MAEPIYTQEAVNSLIASMRAEVKSELEKKFSTQIENMQREQDVLKLEVEAKTADLENATAGLSDFEAKLKAITSEKEAAENRNLATIANHDKERVLSEMGLSDLSDPLAKIALNSKLREFDENYSPRLQDDGSLSFEKEGKLYKSAELLKEHLVDFSALTKKQDRVIIKDITEKGQDAEKQRVLARLKEAYDSKPSYEKVTGRSMAEYQKIIEQEKSTIDVVAAINEISMPKDAE